MAGRVGVPIRAAVFIAAALLNIAADASETRARVPKETPPATGEAGVRTVLPLATGWRFRFGDTDPAVISERFDDSTWSTVSVPHTWNRVGYYLPDPPSHLNRRENVNRDQGVGWYRLTFTAPAAARGHRTWLQFDAASRVATVWLNGQELGKHAGSFSRFRLDATSAIRAGSRNLLVVRTDNTPPAPGTMTADTLPYAGDFFVHGGLYRPVSLVLTDDVHLDMLDYGGPGTYATTTRADTQRAEIAVRTRIRNDTKARERVTVVAQLLDASGATVARSEHRVASEKNSDAEATQTLVVDHPRLWQGVEDPYLYTLRVELRTPSGHTRDALDQPFGVRTMGFDVERGFLLNGRPLRLHGVAYHQDREGKGWAVSAEDTAEDVAIIREMGANSIRLTHYQHGQPVHELADRYGLVLWDEIPLVAAWTLRGQSESSAGLVENAKQQLRELIRQNQNHASVAVWSIANEVDFGTAQPNFSSKSPASEMPDPRSLLKTLHSVAKAEDPSRATTLATCCELYTQPSQAVPTVADITDVAGANRYFGWYYGAPQELGAHLDKLHALRPRQPLSVSEYGAGGATTMHTDDPRAARSDPGGRPQPEEYMSLVHEENWRDLTARSYLWATWLWNGFDFATSGRHEGDSEDVNTKGLVTYDRKIRKDPYYFYRANWSDAPTVHVNSSRYTDRAYAVTDVRVYSNAPATELTLNGRSLGVRTECPQRTCVWPGVRLDAGTNRVVAIGKFADGAREDAVEWRLDERAAMSVRIDSGAILPAASSRGRFGSDAFVEGGTPASADRAGGGGQPRVLAAIVGSPDRELLATYREGAFRYRVPLPGGCYAVTLTFIEPSAAPGQRVFDVYANDSNVLKNVDVAASAGAVLKAYERRFEVTVKSGELTLDFRPVKGSAIVSAIEIEPCRASPQPPLAINSSTIRIPPG